MPNIPKGIYIMYYQKEIQERCVNNTMLIKYINKAMSKALYDKLEDSTFSGTIPQCPGVIAFGETLYNCQQELLSALEGWIIVKIRHGDNLPIISGINLNKNLSTFKSESKKMPAYA
ncbi:hypothetical protein GMMP15_20002 [Candidatus Magnetomoraceae bacterium gMMP-15]